MVGPNNSQVLKRVIGDWRDFQRSHIQRINLEVFIAEAVLFEQDAFSGRIRANNGIECWFGQVRKLAWICARFFHEKNLVCLVRAFKHNHAFAARPPIFQLGPSRVLIAGHCQAKRVGDNGNAEG